MTRWLLDTNVLSEMRRPRPAQSVLDFLDQQPFEALYVSIVTFAEIRYGIEKHPDDDLRVELASWLASEMRPMFDRRVLPVTEDVILAWRLLIAKGRRVNHTFPQPDLLIAATAAHHGMTIVTRDTKGFDGTGVPVHNPWKGRDR